MLLCFFLFFHYGIESIFFSVVIFVVVFPLYFKLTGKRKEKILFKYILLFIKSFFLVFPISFKLAVMLFSKRIHRGIFEIEAENASEINLFFFSVSVTVIPDTIVLAREGKSIFIHKISLNKKEAHEKGNIQIL